LWWRFAVVRLLFLAAVDVIMFDSVVIEFSDQIILDLYFDSSILFVIDQSLLYYLLSLVIAGRERM